MRHLTKFLLAAGTLLAYHSPAQGREYRVRARCTESRCVHYSPRGDRLFTSARDDTGRLVIRDRDYRVRAKVTEEDRGTARIEEPRRRW